MRVAEMRLNADTMREVERLQEESMPKEDLSPFAGEWVALRKGHLIGHDKEYENLMANAAVCEDDVIVHVPGPGEMYFV